MTIDVARRVELVEGDLRLVQHRLTILEEEDLPRRVAAVEPTVRRVETKLDTVADKIDKLNEAVIEQRGTQKLIFTVAGVIVVVLQLIPLVKGIVS